MKNEKQDLAGHGVHPASSCRAGNTFLLPTSHLGLGAEQIIQMLGQPKDCCIPGLDNAGYTDLSFFSTKQG